VPASMNVHVDDLNSIVQAGGVLVEFNVNGGQLQVPPRDDPSAPGGGYVRFDTPTGSGCVQQLSPIKRGRHGPYVQYRAEEFAASRGQPATK
jgi:hypothetical protein